jgi:hypothetical protein
MAARQLSPLLSSHLGMQQVRHSSFVRSNFRKQHTTNTNTCGPAVYPCIATVAEEPFSGDGRRGRGGTHGHFLGLLITKQIEIWLPSVYGVAARGGGEDGDSGAWIDDVAFIIRIHLHIKLGTEGVDVADAHCGRS